jgi:hydrogenase maturation protein HypF
LLAAGAREGMPPLDESLLPWTKDYAAALPFVRAMLQKNINCPQSSSCGRFFDAVAALCGLCNAISYEGQAAIRLEAALDPDVDWNSVQPYALPVLRCAEPTGQGLPLPPRGAVSRQSMVDRQAQPVLMADSLALFAALAHDVQQGRAVPAIAASFHAAIAQGFAAMAAERAAALGLKHVGLSGGVLCNAVLARLLPAALQQRGLIPLVHHELPAGDGGLALGQAVWGRQWLALHTAEGK